MSGSSSGDFASETAEDSAAKGASGNALFTKNDSTQVAPAAGDTPPFVPTVGQSFDPKTEAGIVQKGGGSVSGGYATITSIRDANDAQVDSTFGEVTLGTTNITITAINSGVSYTTKGSQDASGTDLDGLGGITISNTTEFDTTFVTNVGTLTGQSYYIGTDGTHVLVESVIVVPSNLTGLVGNGGTVIVDAVLDDQAFINSTDAVTVNYTFDTEGAVVACYLRGTMIATPSGEQAIETLQIGDAITTASGEARAIRWIGRRSYAGRFAAGNAAVQPILFEPDSIADGVPARALSVSPEHAMLIDEVLVPASCLVNGTSIRRLTRMEDVEYFHIELDSHDVLLADGAPSESFVDCDSRQMFHNAHEYAALYPNDDGAQWTFCAPRLEDGGEVASIRLRLMDRAEQGEQLRAA